MQKSDTCWCRFQTYCLGTVLKIEPSGRISLVIQQLRLHDFNARSVGSIPGQGTCHAAKEIFFNNFYLKFFLKNRPIGDGGKGWHGKPSEKAVPVIQASNGTPGTRVLTTEEKLDSRFGESQEYVVIDCVWGRGGGFRGHCPWVAGVAVDWRGGGEWLPWWLRW